MDLNSDAVLDNAHAISPGNPPVLIANNVVYNNGGRCIEELAVENIWIVNNTCYKSGLDEFVPTGSEFYTLASDHLYLFNNIAQSWANGSLTHPTYMQVGSGATANSNILYLSNLWFGIAPNFTTNGTQLFRNLDPQFVLPPTINAQTSPAPAGGQGQYNTALSWTGLGTGLELRPAATQYASTMFATAMRRWQSWHR
jgi:hypothetical protein